MSTRPSFEELGARLAAAVGYRLFTVSRILPGATEVERIFTTMPQAYPLQGRKTMDQTEWTRMMARGECFVANRAADFGEHFGDLEQIVALGLGAVLNMPVHHGGRQLGTLNLLDATGAYGDGAVQRCRALHSMAVQAFLRHEEQAAATASSTPITQPRKDLP